jgi:glutamate/aspartate transport system permease protein
MNYNWNWGIFFELSPDGSGTYISTLLMGLRWTLVTAFSAWGLTLLLGSVVGVLRTLPSRPAQMLGNAYVELFRNIPFLVQLVLWYFVLPEVLPNAAGNWLKQLPNAPFWTTVIGLGFYMSARVAEQVRAGVNALPRGQRMAGMALGLTTAQSYRYVLLPMAFRIILPPLTSEFLTVFKNTALALTIGVIEITATTRRIEAWSFRGIEAYTVASLTYIATTILVILFMSWLERRYQIPGLIKRGEARA